VKSVGFGIEDWTLFRFTRFNGRLNNKRLKTKKQIHSLLQKFLTSATIRLQFKSWPYQDHKRVVWSRSVPFRWTGDRWSAPSSVAGSSPASCSSSTTGRPASRRTGSTWKSRLPSRSEVSGKSWPRSRARSRFRPSGRSRSESAVCTSESRGSNPVRELRGDELEIQSTKIVEVLVRAGPFSFTREFL